LCSFNWWRYKGIDLGTKVILQRQKQGAEEVVRQRALEMLESSGYEFELESLNKTLQSYFELEDEEALQDENYEQMGSMMPNILKIFA